MTKNLSCPVCQLPAPDFQIIDDTLDYHENKIVQCARCGKFLISRTASAEVSRQDVDTKAKLSSWIRMHSEFQLPVPTIKQSDGTLYQILGALPNYTPNQKQSILLNIFAQKSKYPGEHILVIPRFDYPLAWAINEHEFIFYTKSLIENNLIDCPEKNQLNKDALATEIIVTAGGWNNFQKHSSSNASSGRFLWEPIFQHPQVAAELQKSSWDVFICHASEDKNDVVDPLARELQGKNLKVWYDKWVLKIGDRLLEKIDKGLAQSRYGVVVLSPHFLKKEWPKNELEGLIQKEVNGQKVILPVWHNVTGKDLLSYSPILAGRVAGSTKAGIKALTEELIQAMEDLQIRTEEVIGLKEFDINASFKKISITGELHRYSFIFAITLNTLPARDSFQIRLYWPSFIRVVRTRGFTSSSAVSNDNKDFMKYCYQNDQILYPGESMEIISPKGRAEIEYEFDHEIWSGVEDGSQEVIWEIYFQDQMPLKGRKNFKNLNIF